MVDLLDVDTAKGAVQTLLEQLKNTQPFTSVGIGKDGNQIVLEVLVQEDSHLLELPSQVEGFPIRATVTGPISAF